MAELTTYFSPGVIFGLDFDDYEAASDNRPLYDAIVSDLERTFGRRVRRTYGDTSQASIGSITIGETQIDELLFGLVSGVRRKAVAVFVIAHEYAHVYLGHPDVLHGQPPPGFSVHATTGYRHILELQADYIAARYVRTRGLPLSAVERMFTDERRFRAAGEYPGGPERIENVRQAMAPEFRRDLFANELLDCLEFLDVITARLV